ncbi:MAG: TIGR03905 family TSCPD domain-containing protein [Bacteroidaceae bacterium]|nr:TIGR03905 family TSCPD domain-containing protein [Bacteroidaceae bacterium]
MKKYTYKTQGTCSQAIEITVDDDNRIESLQFIGGCDGNTKGISSLVRGMKVQDVIAKLRGITCGYKSTSCPDQLSKALEAML